MGQLCSLPPQDRAKIWCELAYVLFMSVSPCNFLRPLLSTSLTNT